MQKMYKSQIFFLKILALFFSVFFYIIPSIYAGERLAFTLGIDQYTELRDYNQLKNSVNDSKELSNFLRTIDFQVTELKNATLFEFIKEWEDFREKIKKDDEVFLFFSGHGVEIEGTNYLLTKDTPFVEYGKQKKIIKRSIDILEILSDITDMNPRTTVLIVDACRENPFIPLDYKGFGRRDGIGQMDAPEGVIILYAAASNGISLDRLNAEDDHPNSVYMRYLLPLIRQPNVIIQEIARSVQTKVASVAEKAGHKQRPAYYDQLSGSYCLHGNNCGKKEIEEGSLVTERGPVTVSNGAGSGTGSDRSTERYITLQASNSSLPLTTLFPNSTVSGNIKDEVGNVSESAQDSITSTDDTVDTTKPTSASISIDGGNSETTSSSVTLTLSASDNVGVSAYYALETNSKPSSSAGGWTSVTATTSYSGSASFSLATGTGTKTVYVWFKDSSDNVSDSANDSITLTTTDISFSPFIAPEGGTVILNGTGFTEVNSVLIGTKSAIFFIDSDSQISMTVPSGASSETINIQKSESQTSSSERFFVLKAPEKFNSNRENAGQAIASGSSGVFIAQSGQGSCCWCQSDQVKIYKSTDGISSFSKIYDISDGTYGEFGPSIAVNGQTVLVSVRKGTINTCGQAMMYIYRSPDGGSTWESPDVLDPVTGTADGDKKGNMPGYAESIQFDSGYAYVGWVEAKEDAIYDNYFARSSDDGQTWSTPVRVSQVSESSAWFTKFIVSGQNVHLVTEHGASNGNIMYYKSTDRGDTWTTGENISTSITNSASYPSVAIIDNDLIVAIENQSDNTVQIIRQPDGESSWTVVTVFSYSGGYTGKPALLTVGSVIYLGYQKSDNATDWNLGAVMLTRSLDNGITWADPVDVTSAYESNVVIGQFHPQGWPWMTFEDDRLFLIFNRRWDMSPYGGYVSRF